MLDSIVNAIFNFWWVLVRKHFVQSQGFVFATM